VVPPFDIEHTDDPDEDRPTPADERAEPPIPVPEEFRVNPAPGEWSGAERTGAYHLDGIPCPQPLCEGVLRTQRASGVCVVCEREVAPET
jgi:hypothetical protein